jgi:hypothetical protein
MVDEDVTGFNPYTRTITDDVILIEHYFQFLLYFIVGIK